MSENHAIADRISQNLRTHMAAQGITSFQKLAQRAGLSPSPIRQLRRGKIGQIKAASLQKIAQALGISLDQLWQDCSPGTLSTPADPVQQSIDLLEPWLRQWPTVLAAVAKNPDLPATKVIPLVQPVEALMASWGITPIAPIGAELPYNPQLHELMTGTAERGDRIRVRYAGYHRGEKLLWRAKVSPV